MIPLVSQLQTLLPSQRFPYVEDFETFTLCSAVSFGCGVDCAFATANGWIQDST